MNNIRKNSEEEKEIIRAEFKTPGLCWGIVAILVIMSLLNLFLGIAINSVGAETAADPYSTDFTVDGSKIVTVTMENQPTIEDIPDTSKFTSKLLYSIGFSFLLIGLIITGVVFIKKNQKSA